MFYYFFRDALILLVYKIYEMCLHPSSPIFLALPWLLTSRLQPWTWLCHHEWPEQELRLESAGLDPHSWRSPQEVCTALSYSIWLLSCSGNCLTDLFLLDVRQFSNQLFEKWQKCHQWWWKRPGGASGNVGPELKRWGRRGHLSPSQP